jgi:hypothetical protein
VSYDLEAELLRAAHELCAGSDVVTFTIDELREHIASAPRRFVRLAHPLVSHLIGPLTEHLIADGLLRHVEAGYVLTEAAHALRRRSPQCLVDEVLPSAQADTAPASAQPARHWSRPRSTDAQPPTLHSALTHPHDATPPHAAGSGSQ